MVIYIVYIDIYHYFGEIAEEIFLKKNIQNQ